MERTALVTVPESLDLNGPAPLLLNFHGVIATSEIIQTVTGIPEKAALEGFITAAPQGIGRSWNAGVCCGDAQAQNIDDVGFTRELVATLSEEYEIHRSSTTDSAPGEHGLLEVIDSRRNAAQCHFAKLVDDRRRGCVNVRAEHGNGDHGAIAFRNLAQTRNPRALEQAERYAVHLGDFGWIRFEAQAGTSPHYHRGNDESRTRRVVVEPAEDRIRVQVDADLLV